ncbi:MAG: CehA/McbA family metallohydrolase [Elusimicrobiota bacterium]|nr:CehA/McbA family metallohydrolase [Elusimicrobiota bacterium]
MFDYCGAIHIHSFYSYDGVKKIEYIVESANRCGLDFIIINDHFSIEAKKYEGWHKNTLVIVGEEITPRYNHYLAFDIKNAVVVDKQENNPQKYIDEVNRQGGYGFIAHPDHEGNKKFNVKSYRWNDWSVTGWTGFCIWDLQTDWQETLTGYPKAILSYLLPAYFLTGPKPETLQRWDAINQTEEKYGVGEIDNHENIRKHFGLKLKILKFDFAFRTIRTHIVLDEPFSKDNTDIKKVHAALKSGKSYVSNDYFSNAGGFEFYRKGDKITAKTSERAVIKILRNGEIIGEDFTDTVSVQISKKGVYRCECWLKKLGLKPWIFSNPIFVR